MRFTFNEEIGFWQATRADGALVSIGTDEEDGRPLVSVTAADGKDLGSTYFATLSDAFASVGETVPALGRE